MKDKRELKRLVLQAKPVKIGADLKGFLLSTNDFVSLLNALTEWKDADE